MGGKPFYKGEADQLKATSSVEHPMQPQLTQCPPPSSPWQGGGQTCAEQLFSVNKGRETVLPSSAWAVCGHPRLEPAHVGSRDPPLSPSSHLSFSLNPHPLVSCAFLFLRTNTKGHSVMCGENPELLVKRQIEILPHGGKPEQCGGRASSPSSFPPLSCPASGLF